MTFKTLLYYLPFLEEINQVIPYDKNIENCSSTIATTTSNLEISNGNISITVDLGSNYIKYLFGSYNCIRVNTDDNTLGDYKITSSSQIGGTRVRFFCEPTHYQIARLGSVLGGSTEGSYPYLRFLATKSEPFVEYGYKYDSILTAEGKINWDKNAATDLYRPPVETPQTNIFEGRERVEWNYLGEIDDVSVEQRTYKKSLIKTVKYWINIYVRQGASIDNVTVDYSYYLDTNSFYDYIKDKENITGYETDCFTASPSLPYTIFTFGVGTKRFYIEGKDDSDDKATTVGRFIVYDSLQQPLSAMIKAIGSANILQITASPVPPFNDVFCEFLDSETVKADEKRLYMKSVKLGIYEGETSKIYMYALRCTYINANPYKSLSYNSSDFRTITQNELYNIYSPSHTYAPSALTTYSNPYVTAYTHKMILTSPNGSKYTINPVTLGAFNKLIFSMVYSFELGTSNYIVGIDTKNSDLPYFIQNTSTSAAQDLFKTGVGVVGSNTNAFTYATDKLDEFILNNQNYYATRDATLALQREQAETKLAIKGGTGIISGGAAAIGGAVTGNLPVAIAGLVSMGLSVGTSIAENIITNDNINLSLANSNRMLDDLSNAPDSIIKASSPITDLILDNCAIYINFYTTSVTDKQTLLNDFLQRGIYLNKTVSNSDLIKYLNVDTITNGKKYCKYFKGNVDIAFGDGTSPSLWNTSPSSVALLRQKLANGTYIRRIEDISSDNYYGYDYENFIKIKQPINEFNE